MQNFVVSARKYRPATFETVVGQAHITTTLKNAIRTNHLAQAFLFCGPRGVGKTTCARILAKTINCENLTSETEACGVCKSCQSYQNNNSFNVHELDAASNNSVDDIRLLNEQVRIPPQYGTYKVYIIDEVHMLTTQAFNAFLKTLEEPPRYAIFILATTEKHKIIPTILSRCQIFDFNRIKINDIADQLAQIAKAEDISYEDEGLRVIAQKADGGMRDALSMFDMISTFSQSQGITYAQVISNLHILDSDYYFKVISHILHGDSASLLLLFNEVILKGFDGHLFSLGLADHIRNLLVASDPSTLPLLEASEEKQKSYMEQSAKASPGFYLNLLNLIAEVDMQYRNSKNQRLLVELCLLKMANLHVALQSLAAEKKKSESVPDIESMAFRNPPKATLSDGFQKFEKSQFKSTPSLKVPLNQVVQSDQIKTDAETTNEQKVKKELSKIGLSEAKKEYLEWHKNFHSKSVSSWKVAGEERIEGTTCFLTFANDLSRETFESELPTINTFFQENFDSIPNFELLVSKEVLKNLRPYSNGEKLQYLSTKYPKLLELRKRFLLEGGD